MRKQAFIIQAIVLIMTIAACDSGPANQTQNVQIQPDSLALQAQTTLVPSTAPDTSQVNDCTRGAAEAILKKSVFPQATFRLQPNKITGIETVSLGNGDQLTITNDGCEYYCLAFRFETARFQADTSNVLFWSQKAAYLMREISKGIDAPIDIAKGVGVLTDRINEEKAHGVEQLAIGDEIDYGSDAMRQFVTVNRVKKINDKKYAIEIYFAMGPL